MAEKITGVSIRNSKVTELTSVTFWMREAHMELIDKTTGEILTINRGGLYTPFPVPAYKVLARAKEHVANRILVCLVSHLGKSGRETFPSYSTIANETGCSRNSIRGGLQVLYEYGFVKVYQVKKGKQKRNIYYIQDACYDNRKMNKISHRFMPQISTCLRCRKPLTYGEIGQGLNETHHYGCGGITTKPKLTISESTKDDR
jgi:hypothetical protein